jgi:uncharacterized protein (DUF305 family)
VQTRAALVALLVGALAVVSLTRAGAIRNPSESSPEAGFARDMMVHHEQAVEMAEIVRDRTEDPELHVLAIDIALIQQAQIGRMHGWLDVWGLPTTGTDPPMAWMGHPVTGRMPAMASPDQVAALRTLAVADAERKFLRLIIRHHEAGVSMAEAVLSRTDRPEVRQLPAAMATSQQVEIEAMQDLLRRLEPGGTKP